MNTTRFESHCLIYIILYITIVLKSGTYIYIYINRHVWAEMAPVVQCCVLHSVTIDLIIIISNFPYIILYSHNTLCFTYMYIFIYVCMYVWGGEIAQLIRAWGR